MLHELLHLEENEQQPLQVFTQFGSTAGLSRLNWQAGVSATFHIYNLLNG